MAVPRKVSVISTEYFDILYSNESQKTAAIVAKNADGLYLKAKAFYQNQHDIRTIVVISPDSDVLSIEYTSSPYNRIVIYEGLPAFEEASYVNGFMDLFYKEIAKSVSQSVRSEFWEKVSKIIAGDSLQPVALMNMPFTFLEGAVNAELRLGERVDFEGAVENDGAGVYDKAGDSGLLSDKWNLQLLSQMKLENKMPTLLQMEGGMDIYPGEQFVAIAGAAFCAYMQQRWGLEKFAEFWTEGGKSKFFKLNEGIFELVYGYSLSQAWKDFIEEIPLPQIADMEESESSLFFNIDNDSVYKFLLHSQYGFIWYDELKKEVDIYDTFNSFKTRQLLFLASEVNNLSLSPDGRYLAISYTQDGIRENFKGDVTEIFDLQQRVFLNQTYRLRSAAVYKDKATNRMYIAGVDVRGDGPVLCVYECKDTKSGQHHKKNKKRKKDNDEEKPLYSRRFASDAGVFSPVFINGFRLAALVCQKNEWFAGFFELELDADSVSDNQTSRLPEVFVQIECDEILKIHNLRKAAFKTADNTPVLAFDFILNEKNCFTRPGLLFLNEFGLPEKAVVLENDYSGGINDAVFYENKLYYSSHKFNFDEFRFIATEYLKFSDANVLYPEIIFPEFNVVLDDEEISEILQPQKKYNPWKYMFHGSWLPLMPVRDITLDKGPELWPGGGLTFETQADPFTNNQLIMSVAAGFLPNEFIKLFNASKKEREELAAKKAERKKDFTSSIYMLNTSTPVDLSLGGIFKFNPKGEYSFKALTGARFEYPLRMSFRRMEFDIKEVFTTSTTYRDSHQQELFPVLQNWPSFIDSYRNLQLVFSMKYSNIHQYGISPFKKMGIEVGTVVNADWDFALIGKQMELVEKKVAENTSEESDFVKHVVLWNQKWKTKNSPSQINAGITAQIEIPHLTPLQNHNGWILSFPSTISTELFYTNGTAFNVNTKVLLAGMEIQNGFNTLRLYFPRFGFYGGYNFTLSYDTETVVLPDLRDFTRFHDVFSSCYLNDSVYCNLLLYTTPVIGKFSVSQLITNVTFEYFLRTRESKLSCNFKIDW